MKIGKICTCLPIWLALSVGMVSAQTIVRCESDMNVPDEVAAGLDNVLSALVNPDDPRAGIVGYAPGGVLSLRAEDWQYARATGVADLVTGAPLSCDIPFQIGSNTKMMTATVLLQLVEEGVLALDDNLSLYAPFAAAQLPHLDEITLRQLANHTAGVFSYTDNAPDGTPGIMDGDISDPAALRRKFIPDELVEFAVQHGTPNFAPGTEGAWSYSNTGYILLGMVIEAVEGRTLAESFRIRIFDPLEMDDTFLWNDVTRPEFGLPRSYYQAPFDIEVTDWNMSQAWAAGAVISTTEDMHIFITALLDGDLFRSENTLRVMQQTVPTNNPILRGYGIGLADKGAGAWGHGGQTLGFESDVVQFVDAEISMVGWATSSGNLMVAGADAVSGVLVGASILPDPAIELSKVLRQQMVGHEWQLEAIEMLEGTTLTPEDPASNTISFGDDGSIAVRADCNQVLGDWTLDRTDVAITLGPTTLALCPPGSLGDAFREWIPGTTSAFVSDGVLTLVTTRGSETALLNFNMAK